MTLILASTSVYRQSLLKKLGLKFKAIGPHIDETAQADESPQDLVKRLAYEKAQAVATQISEGLVIGSDQVAVVDGQILGKPGNHQNAVKQLSLCKGKAVTFYTGLCVIDAQTQHSLVDLEPFVVNFRDLSSEEIEGYLNKEAPYNCAGSFKSEGMGICLFESLEGRDPNALIGLPLILLNQMLKQFGVNPLTQQ